MGLYDKYTDPECISQTSDRMSSDCRTAKHVLVCKNTVDSNRQHIIPLCRTV